MQVTLPDLASSSSTVARATIENLAAGGAEHFSRRFTRTTITNARVGVIMGLAPASGTTGAPTVWTSPLSTSLASFKDSWRKL